LGLGTAVRERKLDSPMGRLKKALQLLGSGITEGTGVRIGSALILSVAKLLEGPNVGRPHVPFHDPRRTVADGGGGAGCGLVGGPSASAAAITRLKEPVAGFDIRAIEERLVGRLLL
jgi:hypothetical protein